MDHSAMPIGHIDGDGIVLNEERVLCYHNITLSKIK
jgi:hypothetical protein